MSGGTQRPPKDEKKAAVAKPKPVPASGGTQRPKKKDA